MADSGKVDPYGFERPDDFDYASYEEFMAGYLSVLARRASKWSTYMGQKNAGAVTRSRKAKRYIRKGIPAEHRPVVWMYISGAEAKRQQDPTLYNRLLKAQHDADVIETIKTDLERTFPDNIYFQNVPGDPSAKLGPLFNVLVALAHNHKNIGYCQGLNFIAGLLLLTVKDEDKVFWLMDTLISDILPDYYSKEMLGVKVDQEVLGELVKLKMPDVAQFLEKEGVAWALVSTKWFICLFADVFPTETVLRIWDCLFNEGNKIMFRVGVTLVKMHRLKILQCKNFPEIVTLFKEMTGDNFVLNCHEFMQSIFTEPGSFPRSQITKLQKECTQRVLKQS